MHARARLVAVAANRAEILTLFAEGNVQVPALPRWRRGRVAAGGGLLSRSQVCRCIPASVD